MGLHPFHCSQFLHCVDKILEHRLSRLFGESFAEQVSASEVVGEGSHVEEFDEELDPFVFFDVFEDFDSVNFFFLVVAVEVNFSGEVLIELFLKAVLAEVDVLELHQPIFAEPGQTVVVSERAFFLSPSLENPKLVILLHIFFLLGVVPPVVADQTTHALVVSDPPANLVGFSRNCSFLIFDQGSLNTQHVYSQFEDRRRTIRQQSLHFRHADPLRRQHAVQGVLHF